VAGDSSGQFSPGAHAELAPAFTTAERLALAGFLAGYTGLTRQAYELDLRQFACAARVDLRAALPEMLI
jgi:hypothetical protein